MTKHVEKEDKPLSVLTGGVFMTKNVEKEEKTP